MPSYVVGFALCAMLLALVALAGMSVYDWARRRYGRFYRLVGFWAFALGVCAADYVGGAKPDPTDAPPCLSAPIGLGAARACASPPASQLDGEGALANGFRFTSIDRYDDSVALGLSWNGADFTTSPFIEVFSRTNLTAGGWRYFMDMMEYVTFSFGCATFQLAVSEADPTTVYVRYLSLADAYDGTSAIIGAHGLNGRQELLVANDEPGSVSTGMTLTYHWGRGTDPLDPDSDGDGLPDGWEVTYGMDPLVHNGTLADPRFAPDADPDAANADDEILKTGPGDDRDGKIDEDDRARLYAGRVFRHWVNDDDDTGDVAADSESDIPGARTGAFELDGRDPDWDNDGVDGRCDLLDFAPVRLDIAGALDQLDGDLSDYAFRLTQSDAALNVIWTGLGSTNAAAYLTGEVATCGAALNENSYEATVAEDDDDHRTIEIPASVLNRIRERPESGIVLVEGRAESQSPLVFECRLASGGELVFKVEMPMSISGVEKMCRWLGLRHVCDEDDVAGLSTNAPPNCPDNETDDRNFVFVHGYNVGPEAARGWAAELFKRLWQSGSRSKFTAVDWYGDDSRFSVPVAGDVSPDYYANVQHAFATARRLPAALASLQGTKVLLAHSLGNMVVSSAAVDHQLAYAKYYMLNAAVPMEAYDASSQTNAMVDSEWLVVSNRFRASGWHSLFTATNDFRSTLTWKGRFAGIRNAVNCYSETEDVLSNAQVGQAKLAGGAWKGQELTKGTTTWNWLDTLSLGLLDVSCEGGWGVSSWYGTDPTYYIYGSGFREKANTLDRATAVIAPLFTRFSAEREAMQSTNLFVVADEDYARELRAKFLADAIPAESFAAGANALRAASGIGNCNFQSETPNGWPLQRQERRGETMIDTWLHSDLKNVAFYYVYKLFEKIKKGE